jgi:formate dehydrogenase
LEGGLNAHKGYAGDVWNVQPAPKDHVWRTMKNPLGGGNGMVPHYSGTTLDAQARYASGVRSILGNYLEGKPQEAQNVIVGIGTRVLLWIFFWSFSQFFR